MKEPISLESLAAELAKTNGELSKTKRELRRSRLITAVAAFVGLVGIAGMTAPQAFAQGPGPTAAQVNAALLLLTGRVTTAENSISTANSSIASLQTAQATQAASLTTLSNQSTASNTRLDDLENKTQYMLVSGTDTIFRGTNLYVQSGLGSTTGRLVDQNFNQIQPEGTNGLGNLVFGYNENFATERRGSHNLVLGVNNGYTSYSGIVVGISNTITAPYASIYGGQLSGAVAYGSVVFGGSDNIASGNYSVVAGGSGNRAIGNEAVVTGGKENFGTESNSTVTGFRNIEDRAFGWRASPTVKN
ncbi:MAG: hypothetical protein ACOYON_16585 [Fimbriimonas sp.]